MPAITIILPVYNGENTIAETVKSLLAQTFTDFELLVCIDGTNDKSEQIVRAFDDKRISVLKNEQNMGLARTLNRLIAHSAAEARYVAMAEQDDYYYPERLKLQYDCMEQNKDVGMVSGISEFYDGAKVTSKFPGILVSGGNYPENHKENFLLNYVHQVKVVNSCMMIRKSVHINNGLYWSMHYPSISVDWCYILRFSLVSKIKGINQPLVRLDRRSSRQSLTSQKTKQFDAARELIRSFYYERKDLISPADYKKAMTTQHLLELGHKTYTQAIPSFLQFYFANPSDNRWGAFVKKKFLRMK